MNLGLILGKLPPEHTDHGIAFYQRQVDRQLGDTAGGEADHQQAAIPGHGAGADVEGVTADHIVNHVGTAAIGVFFNGGFEIFFTVVDADIGTLLFGKGELLIAGAHCNDFGTDGFADLYGGGTCATGSAEHYQRFTGFELPPLTQCVVGRAGCAEQCSAKIVGHKVG